MRSAVFGRYWIVLVLVGLSCVRGVAQGSAAPMERGSFTLFKFAKAIGQETYRLTPRGKNRFELRDDFRFMDRGTKVSLKTRWVADGELRPRFFSTDGSSSRSSELHDRMKVVGERVRTTRDGKTTEVVTSKNFFLIDGYAPAVMQQELMRFWESHGREAMIPLLPTGTVTIRPAGTMSVAIGTGESVTVSGFRVNGLIWGQENLWMDASGRLVALVSIDAELDHFEAVRAGYEAALPRFIKGAAEADLRAMAELAATGRRQPATRLAILGATVIDGRGGAPIRDAVVLLEDDKILAVGLKDKVRVPEGTETLDAHGKWILPGLWDMHAHYEQVEWGPVYLAAGVTTVRDCGNEIDFLMTVRDALRRGQGSGPEILMAGLVDGSGPESLGGMIADTPEEARAAVQRYKAAGALQVKLYSSIKPSLVPVFAAEAHRLGMTVTGHVPTGMMATDAVKAGMDQISHISYPESEFAGGKRGGTATPELKIDFSSARSKEMLAVFRTHHTVFDPTLALFELQDRPQRVPVATFEPGVDKVASQLAYGLSHAGAPAKDEARLSVEYHAMLATFRALHAAGLPIVAGTDQAVPGYSLHREMELYVEAGMTPMEAIQSATSVPAQVMGLGDHVGTVAPGMRADLLILDADPLEDIRATRAVWRTIAGGAVYEPGPLWRSVGFEP